LYAVIFPKGQLPPVKGFWSLTMYDPEHFFYANDLNRYSLGTKNSKTLKFFTASFYVCFTPENGNLSAVRQGG
jgi:hypothetical protein